MSQTLSRKLGAVPDSVWLVAIILIGCALHLTQLGDQSLWWDEVFSWLVATVPLDEGVEWMLTDFAHPPLYYWLLHLVTQLGQSEFILRLSSALLGLVSLPLIYQLGRAMPGDADKAPAVGLLAAALLAINPFHLWFSREARSYQLVFLLALLMLYVFHYLLKQHNYWLPFIAVSALAYITHYFVVFLTAVQLIYILWDFRKHHRFFRRWFLAQALAFVPLTVWLAILFLRGSIGANIGWIPQAAFLAPLLTLWNFFLLYVERVAWWDILALPLLAVGLVLGLWPRQRRRLLAIWLFMPLLILLLLSRTIGVNLYIDRFLIICLPALIVLLARGLTQIRRRRLRTAAVAVLLLLTLIATSRIFVDPRLAKQDWRGAIGTVLHNRQPEDLIVFHHISGIIPTVYYEPSPNRLTSAQLGPEGHAGSLVLDRTSLEPWAFLFPSTTDQPWAEALKGSAPRRLWLIYGDRSTSNHAVTMSQPWDIYTEADSATAAWLDAHRDRVLEHHSFAAIDVLLVELSP